jgi:pyruvate dehydrogenase E1 component
MAYVAQCLEKHEGPVVAATDYVRAFADQVRAFVPHGRRFTVLGTDGYGRSDTRANLLDFFEVNAHWIAHAAIASLAEEGVLTAKDVERAIKKWKLDPGKPNPITV